MRSGVWIDTMAVDEICLARRVVLPATGHPAPIVEPNYVCGRPLPCSEHVETLVYLWRAS